jgi:hypothetical protein
LEVNDVDHDGIAAAQARLGTFEGAERDLLQQLAGADKPASRPKAKGGR